MAVDEVARRIADEAEEALDDDLLAVGWYSTDGDGRTNTTYLSEAFSEHDDPGRGVLETSLLERIGHGGYEHPHEERLTTTVRIYETVADVDIHLAGGEGVVVAVRTGGGYRLDDLLDTLRETAERAD